MSVNCQILFWFRDLLNRRSFPVPDDGKEGFGSIFGTKATVWDWMVVAPILASCPCPRPYPGKFAGINFDKLHEMEYERSSVKQREFSFKVTFSSPPPLSWLVKLSIVRPGGEAGGGVIVIIHSYTTFHLLVYYLYLWFVSCHLKTNSSR